MSNFFLTVSLLLLSISVYYNIRFGIIILNLVDSIEECLDALDEKFKTFSSILEKPVFFDSVEIRQVIQEIRSCQDLILEIANKLSKFGRSNSDEKNKEQ